MVQSEDALEEYEFYARDYCGIKDNKAIQTYI